MVSRESVNMFMNIGSVGMSMIARENGYLDAWFLEPKFLGITKSLQFCYQVKFKEDGEWHDTKVYLWEDAETGKIQFEFN